MKTETSPSSTSSWKKVNNFIMVKRQKWNDEVILKRKMSICASMSKKPRKKFTKTPAGIKSRRKCIKLATQNRQNNAASGFLISWMHHLDPNLLKEKWSAAENKKLFDLHSKYGSHWKEIASHFPGRTDNGIKNQFFSIIRKSLRKACKATGNSNNSNCINLIKPKILSEFLNLPYPPRKASKGARGAKSEGKMTDFIQKFAFNKLNDIKGELDKDEKTDIQESLNKLLKEK